jgi:arabinose-5-phosphate isomerase
MYDNDKLIKLGRAVVETEAAAVSALSNRIGAEFVEGCKIILECKGRTIVIGMGKSGHVANKIAATLASTGTPSFFVHPGEANHGDLGMITSQDVVMALSNSGETEEILSLLPVIKRLGVPLIALAGTPNSTLASNADVNIDVSVAKEACPLGLAPTASTTVSLVMGDAMAIALLETRGFSKDDFAMSHPGGNLGRKLLLKVFDIMHRDLQIPLVKVSAKAKSALAEMSQKGLGAVVIVDQENQIQGIFTDGDIRRALDSKIDFNKALIEEVMTANCKTINESTLAAEALKTMEDNKINALPVVDSNNFLKGIINMHDLLRAKVV